MSEIHLDKQTVKRFGALTGPFFVSELRWWAFGLLGLLAALSITNNLMGAALSYINRDFTTALTLKESSEFMRHLGRYLLVFLCALPFMVFFRYTEERLGLLFRKWLSHRILERYFKNHAFYRINSYEGIDNPDQRIEEDIRSFATNSLSMLLVTFNSVTTIFVFSGVLFSISLNLTIAAVLYAILGSVFTYLLGRPLIGLNFDQLKKEGDYRYKLVNVRDNAESIALYRDEAKEFTRVRQRLKNALKNLLRIITWNRNLNFFIISYNSMLLILPIVIVAPLYLNGEIEFGVISQAASVFVQVVNALSIVVLNFQGLSNLTAVTTRLGTFWEALTEASQETGKLRGSRVKITPGDAIRFNNVSIHTPKGDQTIIEGLNLDLTTQNLFITGVSGTGKSSILRVLAGLWTAGAGEIVRPDMNRMMFLPQRPYLVLGSFRNQFLYGIHDVGIRNAEILGIIKRVGLEATLHRVGGLNAVKDWSNLLSMGEQQRIAFGRLLLARPQFAVLDEATTALDQRSELELYDQLFKQVKTVVSVGYRPSLAALHDIHLELFGAGRWEQKEVER